MVVPGGRGGGKSRWDPKKGNIGKYMAFYGGGPTDFENPPLRPGGQGGDKDHRLALGGGLGDEGRQLPSLQAVRRGGKRGDSGLSDVGHCVSLQLSPPGNYRVAISVGHGTLTTSGGDRPCQMHIPLSRQGPRGESQASFKNPAFWRPLFSGLWPDPKGFGKYPTFLSHRPLRKAW